MCKRDARVVFNFYSTIKPLIDELLGDGDGYAESPMVDIEAIVHDIGLTIKYVPPDEIRKKVESDHAYLDRKKLIIYVCNTDAIEKQRFSIAHEIFHALFLLESEKKSEGEVCLHLVVRKGNTWGKNYVARKGNTWKKNHVGSDEAQGEDIADFFAANLLVPIERFMLWDDKSDDEIASAFRVNKKCINYRRAEIERELKILLP